jgi:hypothetical protein
MFVFTNIHKKSDRAMKHLFPGSVIALMAAAALLLCAVPCKADVLFIHDVRMEDYYGGSQNAELLAGYTPQAMFIDRTARYTGIFLKTFWGKEKEVRETTHFLLDKDQIRELDYHKNKTVIYSFDKLSDINWIDRSITKKMDEDVAQKIKDRYRPLPPKLSVTIHPEKETIGGYVCTRVDADLYLETVDMKKNATSVTLVKQKLWVSTKVPGYDQYNAFQNKLAKRLGLDALRLGNLSILLGYWNGSLDPIRNSLKDIKGYPVKSITTVEGRFTEGTDTASPKIFSKRLKEESVELKKVSMERMGKERFAVPSDFGLTIVE